MKLGELIIEIATKGNTKNLEKALKELKEAERETSRQLKLKKALAKAETEEEKQLIKKNYAQKQEIATTQKLLNQQKQRNQAIISGIKGFAGYVTAISLAIGVLDRFINKNAKAHQSILTASQTSGIDVDVINKYASAGRSKNINVTQEQVAQTISNLSQNLRNLQLGEANEGMLQGLQLLQQKGGKSFVPYGLNSEQYLEKLREGLVGVSDEWASDILTKMGISPDLLPMLRMSKEEFDKVPNRFLNKKQLEKEQSDAQKLIEAQDRLAKAFEGIAVNLIPAIDGLTNIVATTSEILEKIVDKLTPKVIEAIENTTNYIKDENVSTSKKISTVAGSLAIASTLKSDDKIANLFIPKIPKQGQLALLSIAMLSAIGGRIKEGIFSNNLSPNGISTNGIGTTINNNFNNTINTTQPADQVMLDNYQREVTEAQKSQQGNSK